MRVAFHFDADHFGAVYGPAITRLLFSELTARIPQGKRQLFIRRGDLLLEEFAPDADGRRRIAARVLGNARKVWSSMTETALAQAFAARNIWILAVEGLSAADAVGVDGELRRSAGYLGAVEIYLANPVHWVIYDRKLIAAYRVSGDELRLLAISEALDPESRPEGRIREWTQTGLFRQIQWEDVGLRDTVFDDLSTCERAKRVAEIEDRLDPTLGPVVGVVLMRLVVLSPLLSDALHAAIVGLDRAGSAEQLAQASLSCRRFLGQLADAVYPSQERPVKGRKVGPQEVKNRLWAHIEENFPVDDRRHDFGTFEELGKRLDTLDELAQKHIHGPDIDRDEVNGLILKLTVWTYEILTLTPPPGRARVAPHKAAIDRFVSAIVAGHGNGAD